MRQADRTRGAWIALTIALSGCASLPQLGFTDDPKSAKQNADAEEQADAGNASESGVPSGLEVALRQAEAQRKAGDFVGASRTLGQLVLVAPDDPRVLGEYGKTLVAKGQTDDALAFLIRATELQPGDWTLFSAQGVAYDQRGNYAAAQVAYARALTLRPGDPTVLSNAGLSRMQAGDLEGAETLLQQAADAGGDNPRIASNLELVRNLRNKAAAEAAPVAPQEQTATATAAPVAPVEPVAQAAVVSLPEQIQVTEITNTAKTVDANATPAPAEAPAIAQATPAKTPVRKPAPRKTAAVPLPKAGEQKLAAKDVLRRLSPTD